MSTTKIWNKNFIILLTANVLLYMAVSMMVAMTPKYADYLGATSTQTGLVAGAFAYSCLFLKILSGPMIDTYSKKKIVIVAMLVMAVSFAGYGFSGSIPVLIAFRLLQGCAQAFSAASCLALATEFLPSDRLASGIGYYSLAQTACQAFAPTLGIWLLETAGYSAAFFVGSGLMLLAAVVLSFIDKPLQGEKKKLCIRLNRVFAPEALLPAALSILTYMAFTNTDAFMILYSEELGVENISLFFLVYALVLIAARPFVGRLMDRLGLLKVFLPALFFFALSFYLISIARTLPMLLLAAAVAAFGNGVTVPSLQALCMKVVPADRRGAGSCTNLMGQDIANITGPLIGGAIIDACGGGANAYTIMWQLMILPLAVAGIVVLLCRKRFQTL